MVYNVPHPLTRDCDIKGAAGEAKAIQNSEVHCLASGGTEIGTRAVQLQNFNYQGVMPGG